MVMREEIVGVLLQDGLEVQCGLSRVAQHVLVDQRQDHAQRLVLRLALDQGFEKWRNLVQRAGFAQHHGHVLKRPFIARILRQGAEGAFEFRPARTQNLLERDFLKGGHTGGWRRTCRAQRQH